MGAERSSLELFKIGHFGRHFEKFCLRALFTPQGPRPCYPHERTMFYRLGMHNTGESVGNTLPSDTNFKKVTKTVKNPLFRKQRETIGDGLERGWRGLRRCDFMYSIYIRSISILSVSF